MATVTVIKPVEKTTEEQVKQESVSNTDNKTQLYLKWCKDWRDAMMVLSGIALGVCAGHALFKDITK